jgi:MoxR-like ATPase
MAHSGEPFRRIILVSGAKVMPTAAVENLIARAGEVVLGKERQIRLALACLLARGHLLIEDVPGVGKTTLAHVLALLLGLEFRRIQFTSDLLPADITGVSVYDRASAAFIFHPGPIFCQLLLADEVNRATPKTQSALLEAMEERQVSAEGETRLLPLPFFVIATQNPSHQIGTYPLPESQLDRFLMRLHLGYPDREAERRLLQGEDRREMLIGLKACMEPKELVALQGQAARIHVSPALLDYIQGLVAHSRLVAGFGAGLSPRAALSLLAAARAWALIAGRDAVLPEDVQAVLPSVVNHRLRPAGPGDPAAELITAVAIP